MKILCKIFGHKWDLSHKIVPDTKGALEKYNVRFLKELDPDKVELEFYVIKICKR